MKVKKVEQAKDGVINYSGLFLLVNFLKKSGLDKRLKKRGGKSRERIDNFSVLASYCCLLAKGKSDYEQIRPYKEDKDFSNLTGIKAVPSAETLRQRMDELGCDEEMMDILRESNEEFLEEVASEPGREKIGNHEFIRIDIDTVPYDNSDTKKEGVERICGTSKEGYHPIFAHIGSDGWLLDAELRPGNFHSHNPENVEFIKNVVVRAVSLFGAENLVVIMDAGFDSFELLNFFDEIGIKYIMRRNIRKADPKEWISVAKKTGKLISRKNFRKKYRGVTEHSSGRKIVYEVTIREADRHGQLYLMPQVSVFMVWTNISASEKDILRAYRKRGTTEQYHSEVKTEIGIERFPSGKFSTNRLILHLAVIVYNILRFIGNDLANRRLFGLRKATRRRIRTVIQGFMYMAGKVVYHARSITLQLKAHRDWYNSFCRLYALCCG